MVHSPYYGECRIYIITGTSDFGLSALLRPPENIVRALQIVNGVRSTEQAARNS